MQRTAATKTYFRSAGVTGKVVNSKRKASNFFNNGLEKTNEDEMINHCLEAGSFLHFQKLQETRKGQFT